MKLLVLLCFIFSYVLANSLDQIEVSKDVKIVNGQNAARYQFPYQVSFQWDYGLNGALWSHICGGTIISPLYVITAAHCQQGTGRYQIVAGILNQGENTADRQDVLVSSFIPHPSYPAGSQSLTFGDIALARLASQLSYTTAVQPALLTSTFVQSGNAILSGWGYLSPSLPVVSIILQWAAVPIIDSQVCADRVRSLDQSLQSVPIDNTVICTDPVSLGAPISACLGDSGGPLVISGYLIGVTSWGVTPCGTQTAPTMYTRVSSYIGWIVQNIQ